MTLMNFELGQKYTRDEIHDGVGGGGKQNFLPNRDGRILAGCFRKDANPGAPAVILPGKGTQIVRCAEIFSAQREPVPVFMKAGSGAWEFVGNHRVKKVSHEPELLGEHARKAGRVGDVSMVLFLERVT